MDRFIGRLNIAHYVDLLKIDDLTKRGIAAKAFGRRFKDQTGPVALYGHG